jgi:hypothetical protein
MPRLGRLGQLLTAEQDLACYPAVLLGWSDSTKLACWVVRGVFPELGYFR